jgi:hypothetical protein
MGALDPHTNKRNQSLLPGPHEAGNRPSTEAGGQHIVSMEEMPTEIWPSFAAASEDYYSTVNFAFILGYSHEFSFEVVDVLFCRLVSVHSPLQKKKISN